MTVQFTAGASVALAKSDLRGVVVGASAKHWWPDLSGCYRVRFEGHGMFDIHADNLSPIDDTGEFIAPELLA